MCIRNCFFFSSRRRHTRFDCDWSSDVCSSDLLNSPVPPKAAVPQSNSGVQFRDGDRDWHLQFHRVHRSHPWKTNRGAVGILAACGGGGGATRFLRPLRRGGGAGALSSTSPPPPPEGNSFVPFF